MNNASKAHPLDAALEKDILAAVAGSEDELLSIARTLVGFPSLLGDEAPAQDFMEGLFRGMGLKVDRFEVVDDELRKLSLVTHLQWVIGTTTTMW